MVTFKKAKGKIQFPADMTWAQFAELDKVDLSTGARFTVLNAQATATDPNEDSIVLSVDLDGVKLLLTGDAISGARLDPKKAIGKNEKHLVVDHADLVDADILQVGHHGSKTSSRAAFLKAVSPLYAIVSSGPTKYSKVKLPDNAVLTALKATGATLLETYANDNKKKCPDADHVGDDAKGKGGCDNYVIDVKAGP